MPQRHLRPSRMLVALTIPTAAFLATALSSNQAAAQDVHCLNMSALTLPNTTIAVAQPVPAGTFTPPDGTAPITGLPAFCRVAGTIAPTTDSSIGFEVWIPMSGWNGRYAQNGLGGFGGVIWWNALAGALKRGFATSANDMGHVSSPFDASWGLGRPEKIIDFGYRANHEVSLKSEAIVAAYFGRAAAHSYFVGCSGGGREGMMEMQRYPNDFDGWIVGAPAYNWSAFAATSINTQQAITATPGSALPAAKLQLLSSAATAQCDAQDNVTDGVIGNPRTCRFDPGVLQCAGADNPTCLTADQVTAVRRIYAGPRNPRTGQSIYPGFEAGGEANPVNWPLFITNPDGAGATALQRFYGPETGANFVFNDPNWNFQTYNFDSDHARMRAAVDPIVSALDTDLGGIAAAGKKVIHYHGWDDAAIPPLGSINYYRAVSQRLSRGTLGGPLPQISSFYRLFMGPGLAHCLGGTGPNVFGQRMDIPPSVVDARYDMVSAITLWVEQGVPPDQIIATKYVNDDPAQGVLRTQPLCPYPQTAQYLRPGNPNDAASYYCATGTAVPVAQ